jgi:hypothetical protein
MVAVYWAANRRRWKRASARAEAQAQHGVFADPTKAQVTAQPGVMALAGWANAFARRQGAAASAYLPVLAADTMQARDALTELHERGCERGKIALNITHRLAVG